MHLFVMYLLLTYVGINVMFNIKSPQFILFTILSTMKVKE
jgi:hypothetical protein